MKLKIYFIIFFLHALFFSTKNHALENKILFKVNNEIITSIDILNEIEYLSLINKNLYDLKQKNIFEIAKNSIIREKIKIIELSRYFENFEVEKKYYDLLFANFLNKLGLQTSAELKNLLNSKNIKIEIIEKKLKIELIWNQLIVNKYAKDLKVDKKKIKESILKNNFQKEFLISEIVFNLKNKQELNTKLDKIKREIKSSSFDNAALMFSISNSANNGGKLGWIKLNSLNQEIKKEILNTKVGDITDPILIPGGFIILKIENSKETKIITNISDEVEMISKERKNKQLNQFSIIYFNKIKKEILIDEF